MQQERVAAVQFDDTGIFVVGRVRHAVEAGKKDRVHSSAMLQFDPVHIGPVPGVVAIFARIGAQHEPAAGGMDGKGYARLLVAAICRIFPGLSER